jgi:hypothetical protein
LLSYVSVELEMMKHGVSMTPEAVLMHAAYSGIAEVYCNTYEALRLVLDKTAGMFGMSREQNQPV